MDSILCSAGSEARKFYFNFETYGLLPSDVIDTLRLMQVSYCEDVGGVIVFSFDGEGRLYIETLDPVDEIGSELLVERMRREHRELFGKLEDFAGGLKALGTEPGEALGSSAGASS